MHFRRWLAPWMGASLIALAGSGLAQTLPPEASLDKSEVRSWLLRIHEAAQTRNFQGIFVVSSGGQMTSARIAHYEHAKKRGAKIYAELAGFGMSADAFHMTAPNVDGPRRSMQAAMRNAGVNPDQVPRIPVVNNIDVAVVNEPDAIRDALYRQAFGPVRWVECVQALRARGATHVVECGPGKVLAGMVKRIDAELVSAALYDPATLAEVRGLLA